MCPGSCASRRAVAEGWARFLRSQHYLSPAVLEAESMWCGLVLIYFLNQFTCGPIDCESCNWHGSASGSSPETCLVSLWFLSLCLKSLLSWKQAHMLISCVSKEICVCLCIHTSHIRAREPTLWQEVVWLGWCRKQAYNWSYQHTRRLWMFSLISRSLWAFTAVRKHRMKSYLHTIISWLHK